MAAKTQASPRSQSAAIPMRLIIKTTVAPQLAGQPAVSNARLRHQRGEAPAQILHEIPEVLLISPPTIARKLSIVRPAHQLAAAQCLFRRD
jgi:hypothetical protein